MLNRKAPRFTKDRESFLFASLIDEPTNCNMREITISIVESLTEVRMA